MELGITDAKAKEYADKFHNEDISIDQLVQLDQSALQQLGITSMGDRLRVDKAIQTLKTPTPAQQTIGAVETPSNKTKSVDIMTLLKHDRTPTQFQAWCGEWDMQKQLNKYPADQFTTHLYRFCSEEVKTDIKSHYTIQQVMALQEDAFLDFLKRLVTRSNHSVTIIPKVSPKTQFHNKRKYIDVSISK